MKQSKGSSFYLVLWSLFYIFKTRSLPVFDPDVNLLDLKYFPIWNLFIILFTESQTFTWILSGGKDLCLMAARRSVLLPQLSKMLKHFCPCGDGGSHMRSKMSLWSRCHPVALLLRSSCLAHLPPSAVLDCCPVNVSGSWFFVWSCCVD